jgi:hypothetical protein
MAVRQRGQPRGAIVPRIATLAVYLLHHRVLLEDRLTELMAALFGPLQNTVGGLAINGCRRCGQSDDRPSHRRRARCAGNNAGQPRAFTPPKTLITIKSFPS